MGNVVETNLVQTKPRRKSGINPRPGTEPFCRRMSGYSVVSHSLIEQLSSCLQKYAKPLGAIRFYFQLLTLSLRSSKGNTLARVGTGSRSPNWDGLPLR